jgi:hypothetical protein
MNDPIKVCGKNQPFGMPLKKVIANEASVAAEVIFTYGQNPRLNAIEAGQS